MCKIWGGIRIRIRIWIGIKIESRIRFGIKTMPVYTLHHWLATVATGTVPSVL